MKRILLLLALVLTATPMTAIAQQGTMNNIVIFIRFSDDTSEIGTPFSTIDNMLNDSSATSTSMYSYFKQVSYNKLTVISHFFPAPSGNMVISYQDIYPHTYYVPYNSTIAPNGYHTNAERHSRERSLMERAVNWVNANSPVPGTLDLDMDNDGNVDNIVFIVKGGILRDMGGYSDFFWPHKNFINDRMVYIGGKHVYNYNVMFEGSGSMYFNTKVFCHEFFHTLGAPDLENASNNSTVPYVAWWDLMGNGSGHMSAYMKWKYGHWIDSIPTITQPGTYTLHSLGDDSCYNNCYKIASQDPHQWYVLEYRDSTERFETSLHGKGLLIYRIDDRYTGNAGSGVEVYLFRPNASDANTRGNVMEAWFSGNTPRTSFTPQTNPHPWLTGGIPDTSFAIVDISVPDSTISFTYLPVCITPHGLTVSGITDTSALLSWESPSDSVLLQWHAAGSSDLNSVVLGSHSLLLDTLTPATEYEWRVKSICGAGDSSWFTPWDTFFTTQCLLHETTIGTGGTTSNSFPFNTWYKYSYTQMLYTAAEIGEARQITTLAFNYSNGWNPLVNKDSCVIYLGTTTDTAFIDQMDSYKPFNLLHKVYEGPIDCVYGWNNIELDRPFYYNGTETLIVAIDDNSGTENFYDFQFKCSNTPGRYTSVTCFDDNINFDPAGNFFPYRQAFQTRADIRFIGCSLSEMPRFDVTVSSSDSLQGSVTGGGTYDVYSFATVTAIPATNYHFVYWLSGGDTITANPYTFSVTADSTLVACFAIDSFTLSLSAIGGGAVSGGGMYAIGSTATITATASDNHHFLYWTSNEDTITYNPCTFTVTSDTVFVAHFAIDSHYVSVLPSDSTIGFAYLFGVNGELLNSALLPHGYLVDIYATPNQNMDGYQCTFLQWSDGNTEHRRLITLTQDTVLVAMFEAQPLEGIPTAIDSFTMAVHADGIEVVGAAGQVVILCDVMGRTLWRSVAGQRQFIPVSHAGVYLLRVGDQAARKVVFR
ncbi:MAG: M6 family metalloprotease domain-containing protein [Bacteroidales bacterium]|nr:M6 family metalloprotease domain-containing protein [Bacteroidales bacterium]